MVVLVTMVCSLAWSMLFNLDFVLWVAAFGVDC